MDQGFGNIYKSLSTLNGLKRKIYVNDLYKYMNFIFTIQKNIYEVINFLVDVWFVVSFTIVCVHSLSCTPSLDLGLKNCRFTLPLLSLIYAMLMHLFIMG